MSFVDPDGEPYNQMVGRMRQRLGLSSLNYQRLDDLITAIGLPREKICTYCWSGDDISLKNGGGCKHACKGCARATACKGKPASEA